MGCGAGLGEECFEVGHRGRWWLVASVHGRSHPALVFQV